MFDRYVADKRKRRPWLYFAFVASTILEGLLILFFIIYSIIHVEEVQPPPITVSFMSSAPPPPPPPPPKKKSTPKPVVKPTVQPKAVPSEIVQPKKEDEKPPEEDKGADDGVEGGVEGGVAGGVVTQAPPPPPPPQKVVNKPAFMVKKDKIAGIDPHLPDVIKLQHRGENLTATYKICIDTSGHVTSVTAVSGIPGADDSITATLRSWVFKPQIIPVCFMDFFRFEIG